MNFYDIVKPENILYKGLDFFIAKDNYPVSPGHLWIISNKIRCDFFELEENERNLLPDYINKAKRYIEKFYIPDGYNIGMNCGEAAGQSVNHFHCHVIPRYSGDMENPRGGVRHCITGKGNY